MTSFRLREIVALLLLTGLARGTDPPALTQPALTQQQYSEQLQRYGDQVGELSTTPQKGPALRDSIPSSVTVQTSRGDVAVDTQFLRDGLDHFLTAEPKAKAKILSDLGDRLRLMRVEADAYDHPDRTDDATRKRLDEILASREFNRIHGRSALDLWKERIGAWILKQLRKISPKVPDLQNAGQIFVWIMIGLAAAVAGVWLYRISRDSVGGGSREIIPFRPSSRSWQEWLAQAREQAAQGKWRDAIHFGFWAAVSRLESEGVWPPDKARTPREYLTAIPTSSSSREPFSMLTRKFEASWYGARPTTETDFAQFAANLERLGCR
jgi:hypothetical protein